jgi:hypothetical protein
VAAVHVVMGTQPPARRGLVLCDVSGAEPDAATVDALARLQLVARRGGRELRLVHASAELLRLVAFMGLAEVLPEAATRPGAEAGPIGGRACRCSGRR